MTRIIPCTRGRFCLVDECDYIWLAQYLWSYRDGYAVASVDGRAAAMHRVVVNALPHPFIVDHINHLRRDNRRSNLRVVTASENRLNWGPLYSPDERARFAFVTAGSEEDRELARRENAAMLAAAGLPPNSYTARTEKSRRWWHGPAWPE